MHQHPQKTKYKVIGIMSGTSLDGIDLSLAIYYKNHDRWTFDALGCNTYPYDSHHIALIRKMEDPKTTFLEYREVELQYSETVVQYIRQFMQDQKIRSEQIDLISIHGHTIFHSPSQCLTVQAGNLQYMGGKLKMNIVGNFREMDVCRGGQGAPLAPFGEEIFMQGLYLNLGGIANIGYDGQGFDIVFCNMVLNAFSHKISGKPYDQDGRLGSSGKTNATYLSWLQENFRNRSRQSLSREKATPLLQQIEQSQQPMSVLVDKMRTFYKFVAQEIVSSVADICSKEKLDCGIVYCTGGGAYNGFLISLLNQNQVGLQFVVADPILVQFKQALIFGLLGVKFMEGEHNCVNGIGGELVKGAL